MGYVIKKMSYQVPYGFCGFNIFLPADMTIFSMYLCIAIEAVL